MPNGSHDRSDSIVAKCGTRQLERSQVTLSLIFFFWLIDCIKIVFTCIHFYPYHRFDWLAWQPWMARRSLECFDWLTALDSFSLLRKRQQRGVRRGIAPAPSGHVDYRPLATFGPSVNTVIQVASVCNRLQPPAIACKCLRRGGFWLVDFGRRHLSGVDSGAVGDLCENRPGEEGDGRQMSIEGRWYENQIWVWLDPFLCITWLGGGEVKTFPPPLHFPYFFLTQRVDYMEREREKNWG